MRVLNMTITVEEPPLPPEGKKEPVGSITTHEGRTVFVMVARREGEDTYLVVIDETVVLEDLHAAAAIGAAIGAAIDQTFTWAALLMRQSLA